MLLFVCSGLDIDHECVRTDGISSRYKNTAATNILPEYGCLIVSPANLWKRDPVTFQVRTVWLWCGAVQKLRSARRGDGVCLCDTLELGWPTFLCARLKECPQKIWRAPKCLQRARWAKFKCKKPYHTANLILNTASSSIIASNHFKCNASRLKSKSNEVRIFAK